MKILTLTERKPIIYPPGIISLVLLPVLCLIYLNKHKAFDEQSCINVAVWSPDWAKGLPSKYQDEYPLDKKYLAINLDGDNANNKNRLDFARLEMRRIITSEDTTSGVDFHFDKKAQYWTFVAALDILQTENAEIYSAYKDDIHTWYKKIHNVSRPSYSFSFSLDDDIIRLPPTHEEIIWRLWHNGVKFIAKVLENFWAPCIIFFAMLFFSFRKLYLNLYQP
jgi:hypothetical protein